MHFYRRFDVGYTFKIRSYLKLDFSHDAYTSMGHGSKNVYPHGGPSSCFSYPNHHAKKYILKNGVDNKKATKSALQYF